MRKNYIELIITLFLILLAGVIGYLYAYREYQIEREKEFETVYIDIIRNKNSIRIENAPDHIFFRVDGDFMQDGELELKE
ncbi:hypothetical protein LAT59_04895 [Candidatus Gracilibacteria bacterium]|nr:hypothetical protein [Candidatus Gracilibacteria bacterium]